MVELMPCSLIAASTSLIDEQGVLTLELPVWAPGAVISGQLDASATCTLESVRPIANLFNPAAVYSVENSIIVRARAFSFTLKRLDGAPHAMVLHTATSHQVSLHLEPSASCVDGVAGLGSISFTCPLYAPPPSAPSPLWPPPPSPVCPPPLPTRPPPPRIPPLLPPPQPSAPPSPPQLPCDDGASASDELLRSDVNGDGTVDAEDVHLWSRARDCASAHPTPTPHPHPHPHPNPHPGPDPTPDPGPTPDPNPDRAASTNERGLMPMRPCNGYDATYDADVDGDGFIGTKV